jgi:hypothetical protein
LTCGCAVFEIARMELIREVPDTSLASRFDGEPMVQSFVVVGRRGHVWITTAEALAVPGFGRVWVAAQLEALRASMGARAFNRALASGIRLRASVAELRLAA